MASPSLCRATSPLAPVAQAQEYQEQHHTRSCPGRAVAATAGCCIAFLDALAIIAAGSRGTIAVEILGTLPITQPGSVTKKSAFTVAYAAATRDGAGINSAAFVAKADPYRAGTSAGIVAGESVRAVSIGVTKLGTVASGQVGGSKQAETLAFHPVVVAIVADQIGLGSAKGPPSVRLAQ